MAALVKNTYMYKRFNIHFVWCFIKQQIFFVENNENRKRMRAAGFKKRKFELFLEFVVVESL